MKLLTKEIAKRLPCLYATDNVKTEDKVAVAKFFDPCGRGVWYVVEGEPDGSDTRFFGFVVSPLGPDCDEWGYFSLNELQSVRNRFGLGIERDLHFSPQPLAPILSKVA